MPTTVRPLARAPSSTGLQVHTPEIDLLLLDSGLGVSVPVP